MELKEVYLSQHHVKAISLTKNIKNYSTILIITEC